jgi:hypothetical protein
MSQAATATVRKLNPIRPIHFGPETWLLHSRPARLLPALVAHRKSDRTLAS